MPTHCMLQDGVLYRYSRRSVHVMRAWPEPRSEILVYGNDWRECWSHADAFFCQHLPREPCLPPSEKPNLIPVPGIPESPDIQRVLQAFGGAIDTTERDDAIRTNQRQYARWSHQRDICKFFDTIPMEIRRILASLRNRRWHMLHLLANCPGADDLYYSNPAMCYLLANCRSVRESDGIYPDSVARDLVGLPQKRILEWFGFRQTEAIRKIFTKIQPEALSVRLLLHLRHVLSDPAACKLLAHLPSINAGVLRLVSDSETIPFITPCLLAEVGADPTQTFQSHTHRLLRSTIHLVELAGNTLHLPKFESVRRLREMHDCLYSKMEIVLDEITMARLWKLPRTFPKPPFEGTSDILPITNVLDLLREGQEMHHCVASAAASVASGCEYIYRIHKPVRCTAAIRKEGENWYLSELKGICNQELSADIQETVRSGIFGSQYACNARY